jgi:predicted ATPase
MPRTCSATPRSACSWRARAAAPGFELTARNAQAIAAICRALDGLPLAIELAAARIRPLPPRALLARLSDPMSVLTTGPHDLPERQRTLRNTPDWSSGLLAAGQKALFARLGVLAGTFGVPAATAICGDSDAATDPRRVLDTLGSLATAAWSAPSPMTTSPGSACWRPSESTPSTACANRTTGKIREIQNCPGGRSTSSGNRHLLTFLLKLVLTLLFGPLHDKERHSQR